MNFSYAIALSGGIASGKSTVSSLLRLYGYCVICADEISHKVLESSTKEVLAVFGNGILKEGSDSMIDRQRTKLTAWLIALAPLAFFIVRCDFLLINLLFLFILKMPPVLSNDFYFSYCNKLTRAA